MSIVSHLACAGSAGCLSVHRLKLHHKGLHKTYEFAT